MGHAKMIDSMITDGLWDAFNDYHMGITAENLVDKYGISREAQDAFAAASQQKAAAAIEAGRFADEITPILIPQRKGDPVAFAVDEQPRAGTTAESLAKLKPAFKKDGSVTAGNASSLNDGAAAVLLMSADKAKALGLPVLARIASYANAGVDPAIMGIGPVAATRRCLDKAGWSVGDLDWSKPTKPLPRNPWRWPKSWNGTPTKSTSTAARLPLATRSAHQAAAYW